MIMNKMLIEVDGKRYENIIDGEVSHSIESIAIPFTFTCTTNNVNNFPVRRQASIKIFLDDLQVCDGYVDKFGVKTGANEHTITVAGNSKTKDLADTSIDFNVAYTESLTLKQIFSRVFAQAGLNFNIIEDVKTAPFAPNEPILAERGQSVWDFMDKYLRKRQVFATTDGYNNVIITRGGIQTLPTALVHRVSGNTRENNIKNCNFNYDDSQRYNKYVFTSQGSTSAINSIMSQSDITTAVGISGVAYDNEIRKGRNLVIVGGSDVLMTAQEKANWERDVRKARSFTGSVTTQGFYAQESSKTLWGINKLVPLIEENILLKPTVMLIKKANYRFSGSGSETDIDLATADSFNLEYTKLKTRDKLNYIEQIGKENVDKEFKR